MAKLFVATTVKLAPTGKEAAELRANHKGYLINVEIVEGNQELGKVLSYLGARNVRFNIVGGGIETCRVRRTVPSPWNSLAKSPALMPPLPN